MIEENNNTEQNIQTPEVGNVEQNNTNISIPESMSVNISGVPTTPVEAPKVRYNPVTGEEMNMDELTGKVKKEEEVVPQETASPTIPQETPVVPTDTGIIYSEEKLKRIQVEYKPPSKFKTALLIIFFIALVGFVIFLPEIQALIAEYQAGPMTVEEITTGKLVCTLSTSTLNLDKDVTRTFNYEDRKLKSAKFESITRGDPTLDEETLDEMNGVCEGLHTYVEGISGVSVICNYEEGKLTQKESFDYSSYDSEKVTAAYVEAGGTLVEFALDEDIDQIMKMMRQGGFTCEKEK